MTIWADWTGFGDYKDADGKFYRAKTLWDVLDLLIVPLFLTLVTIGLTYATMRADERARVARNDANDWERATVFQAYIEKMHKFLLDLKVPDFQPAAKDLCKIAQAQTLMVLRVLDGVHKGMIVRFLEEAELIIGKEPIISLVGADLGKVDLKDAFLAAANLSHTNLSNGDLRDATLHGAYLSFSNLKGADLQHANLSDVTFGLANLEGANLTNSLVTLE